ncbi:MAG: hypothetical protein HY854_00755 [Burkholderiales bacterium]|nr:hypothetical protein [Burkholderiales bacterium]
MRIKKALTSDDMLVASDGARLTVADLLRTRPREGTFQPNKTTTYSLVQATYSACVLEVRGPGVGIPRFKGEVEARIQTDVLRIAGRFRKGFQWKDDRIKLPLKDIVHARVRNSTVDLWLKSGGVKDFKRLSIELFTPEAAGEFVDWLPQATPWPEDDSQPAALSAAGGSNPWMWVAVIGTAVVVAGVLVMLLSRRLY